MRKIFLCLIVASVFFTCGCQSLRQKFIRKKKYEREAPVYLGLKEYPNKLTREAYIDYNLFIRGWLDELIDTLSTGINVKKEKRAINEAVMNVEQLIYFFNDEGKEAIYPIYEELLAIQKEIIRSPNMSSVKINSLIRRVENVKRRFESNFSYSDIEKWID